MEAEAPQLRGFFLSTDDGFFVLCLVSVYPPQIVIHYWLFILSMRLVFKAITELFQVGTRYTPWLLQLGFDCFK